MIAPQATLPEAFVGAWRRTDLAVDGEPIDDADVLWLQSSCWYADLRVPHEDDGGPIEAFAGPARWSDPDFTWEHALDWKGSFPEDVGHLTWDGPDALVETGTFLHHADGRARPYRERWVRTGPTWPASVLLGTDDHGGRACIVRVGDHRFTLVAGPADGAFAVRREDVIDGRLRTTFERATGTELPATDVERDEDVARAEDERDENAGSAGRGWTFRPAQPADDHRLDRVHQAVSAGSRTP